MSPRPSVPRSRDFLAFHRGLERVDRSISVMTRRAHLPRNDFAQPRAHVALPQMTATFPRQTSSARLMPRRANAGNREIRTSIRDRVVT